MWEIIKGLMDKGTTILLTTQYLEEADQLADRVAVIDNGKVIAEGTAAELKSRVGKDRLELVFANDKTLAKAVDALGKNVVVTDDKDNSLTLVLKQTNHDVRQVLDKLEAKKINITSMTIHKPTLDDVFLSLTGKQKKSEKGEA